MKYAYLIGGAVVLGISVFLSILQAKFGLGIGAALMVILLDIKKEKDEVDDIETDLVSTKPRWELYFNRNWDDFLLTWIASIALVALQSYVFIVLNEYYKWDYSFLYESAGQYVLAALLGWFSDTIIKKLYTNRKAIVNKIADKL